MLCGKFGALAGDQAVAYQEHVASKAHCVDCILVLPDRETEHNRLTLYDEAAGEDAQQRAQQLVEAVELQPAQLPRPADHSLATSLAPFVVAGAPGNEVESAQLPPYAACMCRTTCRRAWHLT